jgi:hypothetical protein
MRAGLAVIGGILAGCTHARAPALVVGEPPPVREVQVQLDVPPNAPGEDEPLEVGRFRVGVRGVEVRIDAGGALFARLQLALDPPESRLYRLEEDTLVPTEADSDLERRARSLFDDEPRPAGSATERSIEGRRGRTIATTRAPDGTRPGRIVLETQGVTVRREPAAPDLVASAMCTPVCLALAADPLRVAWLDCAGDQEPRLRVSTFADHAWTHADVPAELLPETSGALVYDAWMRGERLAASVLGIADGAGAILTFDGHAWERAASLPEIRVGRAGRPLIVAAGREAFAAWHEPRREGTQVILRGAVRRRWPLLGRGGVDTSIAGWQSTRPAAAWRDRQPLLAVIEPGGLFVLRWDGTEWRRDGGRVEVAAQGESRVDEVALASRDRSTVVAWRRGGRVIVAERGSRGWRPAAAPLAENVRSLALDARGARAAIAWIDQAGTAWVRNSAEPGHWQDAVSVLSEAQDTVDVAVTSGGTLVALATRGSGAVHVVRVGTGAEDLGGPAAASRAAPALWALPDGSPLVVWPSPEGVRLAVRRGDAWQGIECPAARALGPAADAIDAAAVDDGSLWIVARQSGASTHVRVARCPGERGEFP